MVLNFRFRFIENSPCICDSGTTSPKPSLTAVYAADRMRRPYRNTILQGVQLPAINFPDRTFLVGGFHLKATAEMEIWRRLAASSGITLTFVFFRANWTSESRAEVHSVFDPADGEVLFGLDPELALSSFIRIDQPTRCFAAIVSANYAEILTLGPPTEETWETFENEWLNKGGS